MQLCWAHFKRDFIKISERSGVSQQIGTALLEQQEKLWFYRFLYVIFGKISLKALPQLDLRF
ncbi:hypothetical protein [Dolichospermum sp. UHCC 0259]|uniref:hypothetical protein n=1 Tax=Dolichospermum sp. UHCC 0259 TaxID=2590010 RepID=UPI0014478BE1|nr:hypothetical protein [Dolichospermum sp. UHCC 0259]MTJ48710.1 hypothetical protein [Dolichospermum sp. UHCC 0259]